MSECIRPTDALVAVQDALGPHVKIIICSSVIVQSKSSRQDKKYLVLSKSRLFLLQSKSPIKIELNIHFLEIHHVESRDPMQLSLGHNGKRLSISVPSGTVDEIFTHIGASVKAAFPLVNLKVLIPTWDVVPESRLGPMNALNAELESRDPGPCGGFSEMYMSMCDYHGMPARDEVTWDVDTIYLSQGSREMNLGDFDHLDARDLLPIVAALTYNSWFTGLRAVNIRMCAEVMSQILRISKYNITLEEICLCGCGIRGDFVEKLLTSASCPLQTLDLSYNLLEEKGVQNMWSWLSKWPRGLAHLNLSHTGMSAKGLNYLCQSLASNRYMATTLQSLNLEHNAFKGEEILSLHTFLAQPNNVTTLNLSGSECALDVLFSALVQGCCWKLHTLDLSNNPFSLRRSRSSSVPQAVKQFFAAASNLRLVNLSNTRLFPEAIRSVLLGIASNIHLCDVDLNLSSNDLRSGGAQVMEDLLGTILNVSSLDISDNGLEADAARVITAISKNRCIKKLFIGRNFNSIKPKHLSAVLDALVNMIQDEDSHIEMLSLNDSRLRFDTETLICALGSNTTLKVLDISGNMMGDVGARMLAKALQLNSKLHTLYWDRNGTSLQGFEDVANALVKNYTKKKKVPTATLR